MKDIKERVLPALDDEFAKDVGSFQTLVELRADVHTRLEKMLKDRAETALAEQIVEKLNEKNPLDVPPSLVEQQCRMMEMEILQNARRAGQRVTQEDFQKIHGQVHADAEKKVRAGLLMARHRQEARGQGHRRGHREGPRGARRRDAARTSRRCAPSTASRSAARSSSE